MKNPFEDLGKKRLSDPEGEECEGAFSCQEKGCYDTVGEARYLREIKVLTWECNNGHINKIKDFVIDG
jgi:hypothetical protein